MENVQLDFITATTEDIDKAIKQLQEQKKKKEESNKSIEPIVKQLKELKIDKTLLTYRLIEEGLIIKVPEEKEKKINIYTINKDKDPLFQGKSFSIWLNRDMSNLQGNAKQYWQYVKNKGKDNFLANLTKEGQDLQNSEDFQKYIKTLF